MPLSEPYYCCGTICLERLLFNIDFNYADYKPVPHSSTTFPTSNFAMLRNDSWNVFLKYGLNGRSHAHPDIMNIEVMYKKASPVSGSVQCGLSVAAMQRVAP